MAIPQHTTVTLARRTDKTVRVVSANVSPSEPRTFLLGKEQKSGEWVDYIQAPLSAFERPRTRSAASTLSSSLPSPWAAASPRAPRSKIARAVETEFIGIPIGIIDQMASSLGDDRTALFLDTRSLAYERVALPSPLEMIIIDSGVAHDHATGAYRTRHHECEIASKALGVKQLRDVDDPECCRALPPPLDRRHVVTENARVRAAVACVRARSLVALGGLFDASHASLRDDFDVSVLDVDRLVALLQADADVLGARTGGGFGGAVVGLSFRGSALAAAERVRKAYHRGGSARGRILLPSDGA